MKLSLSFLVLGLFALPRGSARAATVSLPSLSTGGESLEPGGLAHVTSLTALIVNLDDRTGLTPGSPIRLTFDSPDPVIWSGGFVYGPGTLVFSHKATLSALVGGFSGSAEILFGQTFPNIIEGGQAVGSLLGPRLPQVSFIVPWSTDLSGVEVRFGQDSTVSGSGTAFTSSGMMTSAQRSPLRIDLHSVPEPATAALSSGLTAVLVLLCHRRRR